MDEGDENYKDFEKIDITFKMFDLKFYIDIVSLL